MDNNIQDSVVKAGEKLSEIIRKMIEVRKNVAYENLPSLPSDLEPLMNCIGKTDFTLVVSGEVNRGKSTFINAIIGRDILPTYDKETTSQVFKVINSDEESCSIVYLNGDRKIIDFNQLKDFGTQSDNPDVLNEDNRPISYLEIRVPFLHLPKGINIVDTPGIGSTYKQHTEIAKGFMQQADSIIYLCSAKHPLVKVDVDFIKETILPLPTSPNVIFVMAKADQADSEDSLKELIQRTENQLKENFNNNLSISNKVIPIDSLSLQESNTTNSNKYKTAFRDISNFEEVENAICNLIERQKFVWIVSAYNCAARYYKKVNSFLEKCISEYDLDESSRQEKLIDLSNKIRCFEEDYGVSRQRETLERINSILSSMRNELKYIYSSSNSSLLKKYNQKVDEIKSNISSDGLNTLSQLLSDEILKDAMSTWENICITMISKVRDELNLYHKNCQLIVQDDYELENPNTNLTLDLNISRSELLNSVRSEYFTGTFFSTLAYLGLNVLASSSTTLCTIIAGGFLATPVGWIISLGAGPIVYGLILGNKKAKEKVVKNAKSDIKAHLGKILEEVYNSLAKTSLMDGKYESVLKSYERSILQGANDTMESIYTQIQQELKAAKKELENSANQNNRARVVNQQTTFNKFAIELQNLAKDINTLNEEFEKI